MGLTHIYISHAGEDSAVAQALAGHLKDAGHDTKVDVANLSLGDDVIEFMNDGIAQAHVVVILLSKHMLAATWQRLEINAAVWNEHAQKGARCLPVRLDNSPIPPLLGPKIFATLDARDANSMRQLVEGISAAAAAKSPSASLIVAEALQRTSHNPFRHLRAEFLENTPDLHARTFAPPDALTVGSLHEMKPSILEGSRGTGKSMLLLSLRARNYLRRHSSTDPATLYGFYLKLTRGAICNAGLASLKDNDIAFASPVDAAQLTDLTEQELVLQIVESLFSELQHCVAEGLILWESSLAKPLAQAADQLLFEDVANPAASIDELLWKLADAHKRIAAFIRRRFIYQEPASVPIVTFNLDQLKRVIALVARYVPALAKSLPVVLLDEYENLFPYQQRVVNSFVKLGPPAISVKIAKKLGSTDTSGTTMGQELQETHDYTRLPLVYDMEDPRQRRAYHDLLRNMVRNMCACENIFDVDVDRLLPVDLSAEVADERLKQEIAQLLRITPDEFDKLPPDDRQEKWTYYREAATYRVLLQGKGRHRDKRFCGFADIAFLSSGVIRYFQEILGVAYHLSYGPHRPTTDEFILPTEQQTRAVHFVSQHNLTTLSRNVEEHGESLKYFLLDLGDCLRHKLLRHSSEPEAARLTIDDPERLVESTMQPLRHLLSIGEREGVFQTREGRPAFKPKHTSDPQPSEFNICRIYAPVLEISPRLRWRTTVSCTMLSSLLQTGNRAGAMQQMKKTLVRSKAVPAQENLGLLP
jgi:hypothetical protein